MHPRRFGLTTLLIYLVFAAIPQCVSAAPSRPNIIFIMADDLGWKDVGFHGSEISTPNIDRLAKRGARLEDHYVQPVCSQTRAALMTGRYPFRYALEHRVIKPGSEAGLPTSEKTIAEALREGGYATMIIGKWHLGTEPQFLPTARGFQYHYGNYCGQVDYFTRHYQGKLDWQRNGAPIEEQGYTTDLLAEDAAKMIEGHDPKIPLFLYLPFTAPHGPVKAQAEYLERFSGIKDPKRRTYAAAVANLDAAIGVVIEALEKHGMLENSLIALTSDNGGSFQAGANNFPFSGQKRGLYEGALRVPTVISWPGKIVADTVLDQPVSVVDWYPTLLTAANLPVASPNPLDGENILPLLAGKKDSRTGILCAMTDTTAAYREQNWKLIYDRKTKAVELFDLGVDPGEKVDRAKEKPEVVKLIMEKLKRYL